MHCYSPGAGSLSRIWSIKLELVELNLFADAAGRFSLRNGQVTFGMIADTMEILRGLPGGLLGDGTEVCFDLGSGENTDLLLNSELFKLSLNSEPFKLSMPLFVCHYPTTLSYLCNWQTTVADDWCGRHR